MVEKGVETLESKESWDYRFHLFKFMKKMPAHKEKF